MVNINVRSTGLPELCYKKIAPSPLNAYICPKTGSPKVPQFAIAMDQMCVRQKF